MSPSCPMSPADIVSILKPGAKIPECERVSGEPVRPHLWAVLSWWDLDDYERLGTERREAYDICFQYLLPDRVLPHEILNTVREVYRSIFYMQSEKEQLAVFRYCVDSLGVQDTKELRKWLSIMQYGKLEILEYLHDIGIPNDQMLRLSPMVIRWHIGVIKSFVSTWSKDADSLLHHMPSILSQS